ncbi:MAG: hypothetical protein M3O20_13755, partial [Acidobacteriota bacterium]|nr:hypothetical protein [Acidobacteriota bacterium]
RRAQSTRGYGITICRADKNSVDGWDYMRELLRTEQVVIQGAPDAAIVQRLRGNPNGEALVANYLQGFNQRAEVLPKILVHSCCKRLIETIGEMTHDSKDPEKMLKVDGDDFVDSLAYGCAAHRNQQNSVPLAYFVGQQIQEAFAGREMDLTSAHIMRLQAEAKFGQAENKPIRLGRFAGRGNLAVQ